MHRKAFCTAFASYALVGRTSFAFQDDVEAVRYNISKQVVQGFRQDKPAVVKSLLATSFADATSNEQVRVTWARAAGILGPFSSIGAQSTRVSGPYTLAITKLLFAKGHAEPRCSKRGVCEAASRAKIARNGCSRCPLQVHCQRDGNQN